MNVYEAIYYLVDSEELISLVFDKMLDIGDRDEKNNGITASS